MRVLGEIEGVAGATEGSPEVAQHGVDRAELRQIGAGLATAGDHAPVRDAHDLDGAKARQAVGDDGGRWSTGTGRAHCQLLAVKRLQAQTHELRLAVGRGLHGGHERHRVLGAASDLAPHALAAPAGTIDLHQPVKLKALLANPHHLHELALDQPGGLAANARVALERHAATALLDCVMSKA